MVLRQGHSRGGNIQAVIAPDRFPLSVSQAEPGSVHDLTATRIPALPTLYPAAAAGQPALADPGYDGAGFGICIPVKQPASRQVRRGLPATERSEPVTMPATGADTEE